MKTIKKILLLACLSAAAGFLGHAISVSGATATVLVGSGGLKFVPAVTSISVNDSVIWSWAASGHSSTSGMVNNGTKTPDGLWDSGVENSGQTFTNTFTSAGTFSFYCSVDGHAAAGMTGLVAVASISMPPTVTITNPANGATLSAPASLTLAASATNSDDSVTNVRFLEGTTLLGDVAAAPFSIPVNNLAAADYTFSAIASDSNGLTATNSIIVHVINPSPVAISAPAILSAGHFQFSYTADIGLDYVVQVSTNLSDWNSIATNPATSSPVIFTDANAGGGDAFYRVGRLPNP